MKLCLLLFMRIYAYGYDKNIYMYKCSEMIWTDGLCFLNFLLPPFCLFRMSFSAADLAVLLVWLGSFSADERARFDAVFGGLASLLLVTVPARFLRAVGPYWRPSLSLFQFGHCEMTPTPEEYHFMLRIDAGLDYLARIPIDGHRSLYGSLSDLIGVRRRVIREEIVTVGQTPTIRLSFFLELFSDAVAYRGGRDGSPHL